MPAHDQLQLDGIATCLRRDLTCADHGRSGRRTGGTGPSHRARPITPRCEDSQELIQANLGGKGLNENHVALAPTAPAACRYRCSAASLSSPARIRQRGCPGSAQTAPRKQRSLGSERGLATPSPDEKGEITLGPSMMIMPRDPYSTLGRSCEPAYQVDLPARELRGDVTRWLAAGPRRAAMRRAARSPGREPHPRSSPPGRGPDRVTGGRGRGVAGAPRSAELGYSPVPSGAGSVSLTCWSGPDCSSPGCGGTG